MVAAVDPEALWRKLAASEALTLDEAADLLRELNEWKALAAYLASCHAATAESLPRSTSKRERARMRSICETAAAGLTGDMSKIRYPGTVEAARERCEKAAVALAANQSEGNT